MFTQDFDLFHSSPTPTPARPAVSPRAQSLDSTLQPSFNCDARSGANHGNRLLHSAHTIDSTHLNTRPTYPPVPLFHSDSAGNIPGHPSFNSVNEFAAVTMGGGGNYSSSPLTSSSSPSLIDASEINVAYEGTFGDLGAAGDADFFHAHDGTFDFELTGPTDHGFTAINNDGGVERTLVSPRDLFIESNLPSTSFTNLTTPGSTVLETPDDYQTSPLLGDSFGADNHAWYSLFPDTDNDAFNGSAPDMARTTSSSSINPIVVHPGGDLQRKRSSTVATATSPDFSPATKHSNIAGVNARRRDKPLPPIVVNENDPVALKRARNTAAARKSRAKKVHEKDGLEDQISALKREVEFWKNKALGHDGSDSSSE